VNTVSRVAFIQIAVLGAVTLVLHEILKRCALNVRYFIALLPCNMSSVTAFLVGTTGSKQIRRNRGKIVE